MTTDFKTRYGFERADVTIANWRTAPYSQWAFQNAREIVPSTAIACTAEQPETAITDTTLLDRPMETGVEHAPTPRAFLQHAHTDAFVVLRGGEVISEYYAPHADINAPHLIFSISKSLTALVSSVLEDQGVIDPDAPVLSILPEAAGSAYGDCSYRDVLDMRVSLDFEEAYLDPASAFARYRRSMLWNPADPDQPRENLKDFLMTLKKADAPHGGPFNYMSPNSDLLGVAIERASGTRYATLISDLLWKPLGARNHATVTVDGIGTARAAGGVSVTARDLARVGEMLRMDGIAASGTRVISRRWIDDMKTAGDRQAWIDAKGNLLPDGRYRSQWYQTGNEDGSFCAIGIHGQWLYVDPQHETVIVKLSSQPDPLDDEMKHDIFTFLRAVSRADV